MVTATQHCRSSPEIFVPFLFFHWKLHIYSSIKKWSVFFLLWVSPRFCSCSPTRDKWYTAWRLWTRVMAIWVFPTLRASLTIISYCCSHCVLSSAADPLCYQLCSEDSVTSFSSNLLQNKSLLLFTFFKVKYRQVDRSGTSVHRWTIWSVLLRSRSSHEYKELLVLLWMLFWKARYLLNLVPYNFTHR